MKDDKRNFLYLTGIIFWCFGLTFLLFGLALNEYGLAISSIIFWILVFDIINKLKGDKK